MFWARISIPLLGVVHPNLDSAGLPSTAAAGARRALVNSHEITGSRIDVNYP
jgi:hypothetical protein